MARVLEAIKPPFREPGIPFQDDATLGVQQQVRVLGSVGSDVVFVP
jgi:hypothetical protein